VMNQYKRDRLTKDPQKQYVPDVIWFEIYGNSNRMVKGIHVSFTPWHREIPPKIPNPIALPEMSCYPDDA
jgi:hypothetical protein